MFHVSPQKKTNSKDTKIKTHSPFKLMRISCEWERTANKKEKKKWRLTKPKMP